MTNSNDLTIEKTLYTLAAQHWEAHKARHANDSDGGKCYRTERDKQMFCDAWVEMNLPLYEAALDLAMNVIKLQYAALRACKSYYAFQPNDKSTCGDRVLVAIAEAEKLFRGDKDGTQG